MRRIALLLLATFALSPAAGVAQALLEAPAPTPTQVEQKLSQMTSAPQLERLAAKLAQDQDWRLAIVALKRLVELRPHNGHYKYALAAAYAQSGEKAMAYDTLVRMQTAGYAYAIEKDPRFEQVHGTKVWDYLVLNFKANAAEFGAGKVAHELPADDLLIESIAWDPAAKGLLVGSAREGKVFRVAADGKLEDFIAPDADNKLWAIMDLGVDAKRNALYVASAAIPHFRAVKPGELGRAAIAKFDLASGKLLARYELPADGREHFLNSLAVAPNGDVFTADGLNRVIYKVEGDALKPVAQNPRLTSIRGMTVSGDGRYLYFADYELGLFGMELATGTPFEVAFPPNLTLFSIEGLSWYQGTLIAVQAGFPPSRVMRLNLSKDGLKVVRVQALEASRAAFGPPTRGAVVGDDYYVLANSQKGKYDGSGAPIKDAKLEPVRVLKTNLRFAWDVKEGQIKVAPDLDLPDVSEDGKG